MMNSALYYIKKITDFQFLPTFTNYWKKVKTNEEETNKKATDLAPKLEPSTLGVSAISHQSSSSSSSADRNDEIIESQQSSESSLNSIFATVPTKAEADYSMQIFQSFMHDEGPRMLVENPGFQVVDSAFQFMKAPMVQEMVGSLMCDGGVIAAVLRNDTVQTFLKTLMQGDSTLRLTNGDIVTISANISQSSHNLVSVILNWLLENMENGMQGIIGTLRSLVDNTLKSSPNENPSSSSNAGQAIHMTLLLTIINLLIVFVRRALKYKLVI